MSWHLLHLLLCPPCPYPSLNGLVDNADKVTENSHDLSGLTGTESTLHVCWKENSIKATSVSCSVKGRQGCESDLGVYVLRQKVRLVLQGAWRTLLRVQSPQPRYSWIPGYECMTTWHPRHERSGEKWYEVPTRCIKKTVLYNVILYSQRFAYTVGYLVTNKSVCDVINPTVWAKGLYYTAFLSLLTQGQYEDIY